MSTERKEYTYTPFKPSNDTVTKGQTKDYWGIAYNTHINNGYKPSDEVNTAGTNKTNAENAYNTHFANGFTFSQNDAFNDTMNKILNREKFSYDVNGDALYQQYKDKYITQGKMAMADTMGQAAAMTGGYGNSYAASVGNQAYQASLQQLNDVIPELYQMAYDRYNQEGQDLYNRYGMLSNERSTEYGMWTDTGNRLGNDRTYASNAYDSAYNKDYGQYVDRGNMLAGNRDYYTGEYNDAYNRDFAEHTTEEGYKYQNVADANAYAQWKANYDQSASQFDETMAFNAGQAGAKKNADGTYTFPTSTKPVTMSTEDYNFWTDKFAGVKNNADAEALREQMAIAVGDPNMAYELYYQWEQNYKPTAPRDTTVIRGRHSDTAVN